MELLLSLLVGVGLSAACGFRIFIPLLVVSIAASSGHLTLASGFDWIGTETALLAFAVATVLEVSAYYVPWLDNFLDSLTTPAAIVAGTVVTASVLTDMSPFLRWTLATIAGGGAAGTVQGLTVLTRAASTAGTGGLANPVLATGELGGSVATAFLAVAAPGLVVLLLAAVVYLVYRFVRNRRAFKAAPQPPVVTACG